MEKQRSKSNSKFCRRLLILSLLFLAGSFSNCFAQNLTGAMIRNLRIVPVENQQLYTNTTLKFEVVIPYVKPSQVEIFIPDDQDSISFKTLRRVEDYSETEGTKIEIWMSFKKAGIYKIKPLSVRIKNTQRNLQFEPVQIMVNPQELVPEVVVTFSNGIEISNSEKYTPEQVIFAASAGEKIKFRVNLKYAVQLVQYNWEIPKNSIFTETKTYEITELKYRDKVYSEDLIPVADFEWIPLVPGKMELPVFNLSATGYNGRKVELQLPKICVQIEKGKENSSNQEKDYFASAFELDETLLGDENTKEITKEICIRLADLREKEQLAITPSISRERAALEKEYNLPSNQKEFSATFLFASIILLVFFLILFIIFLRRKRLGANIIICVFLICSIIMMIGSFVQVSKKYAVSLGCKIYSIPEKTAEAKTEIPAGNRVKITEEVSDWYYVELGEAGGWCEKNQVLVIKK